MEAPSSNTGKIARSAGVVSIAVMCSRVLGLVREQAFAALFGAGYAYDSFVVAFRIPNLLRDLFGEGALSAAFVTVFTDYDTKQGEKETWRLAGNVMIFFTLLLSIITLLGMMFAGPIVRLLVESEFEQVPNKVALTSKLTVIMFPFLIFISLSSTVMGMLNTKGRFFVPSLASSFFNFGSIVGGVSLALILPKFGQPAIVGMAIGTLIGGALQFVGQLPALYKAGFVFMPNLNLRDPGLQRILKLMVPAVVGLSALQINIFVNNFFASSLQEGSLSWLNYAFRLFQFPVGVFGVALSVATLPVLARCAAAQEMGKLKETYISSLTMVFALTIPASVGLILLAQSIVSVVFEHGRFDTISTVKTAEALMFYAVGLFAYGAVKVMVPVFYALNETRYPVIGSFLAVVVNVIVIFFTINIFGHKALALSISCAMTVNFLFLSVVLYRRLSGFSLLYVFTGLMKIVAAAVLMGGWIILCRNWTVNWFGAGIIFEIIELGILIISGGLVYCGCLYLFQLKELKILVEKVVVRIS